MSSEKPLLALLRQVGLSIGEENVISFEICPLTNEIAKGLWGGYGANNSCGNVGCTSGVNNGCKNDPCGGGITNNGCTNESCS